ncbi:MAG: molecular chaperone DnaJ [Sphingomonas sp. 12-62-6]|nr:MAG: molecular chaperone DnaJ [Sphingomonas sp. 12-62-6]
MLGAIVDHLEQCGLERDGKAAGDFAGNRAGSSLVHASYISGFRVSGSHVSHDGENNGGDRKGRPQPRFHGRVEGSGVPCMEPGCEAAGEFRAPPAEGASFRDQPAPYRWFCLEHVRAFNARYNFFAGMSVDEINAAQRPYAGWERETRAFATGGADRPPPWADFADPLDAIGARFRARAATERKDGRPLSEGDRRALKVLGLATDIDRRALRERYAELVRRYHPDRNGGDRSFERQLQDVIAAYQQLKGAAAFA